MLILQKVLTILVALFHSILHILLIWHILSRLLYVYGKLLNWAFQQYTHLGWFVRRLGR